MSGKFINLLLRLGYTTLDELAAEVETNIEALPGCGAGTMERIRAVLAEHNLAFAPLIPTSLMPAILSAPGPRLRLVKA